MSKADIEYRTYVSTGMKIHDVEVVEVDMYFVEVPRYPL
jgi:hypothetical protein